MLLGGSLLVRVAPDHIEVEGVEDLDLTIESGND